MKYLIVGLGNIGEEYKDTRHNIGFTILDAMAMASNISFTDRRYGAVCQIRYKGRELILLKPSTYMNLSGNAVSYWLKKEKIPVENMLVIVVDIALPLGSIRMRSKGSDGGHNGLASVIYHLQSDLIPRLRFGVASKTIPEKHSHDNMADYVLTRFDAGEEKFLPQLLQYSAEAIQSWVTNGIAKTMSSYNKNFYSPA